MPDRSLDETVRELISVVGRDDGEGLRGEVHAERAERRQQTRLVVGWVAAGTVVVVAAIAVAFLLIERNAGQIRRSAVRVEQVVYDQCATRNQSVRRQNALLDSAIAAERRKPVPNQRQIKALGQFKGAVVDCGARP